MKAGLMLAADPAGVPAAARRAEELGFGLVSSGEHVFFHGPTSNGFLALAAAAAATERVRLVSSLTLLPLYPMALVAKLAATFDRLSRGRFELGVGVGGEYPPEFAASGVPVAGRGRRADEALAVLLPLLSGQPVTADGEFGSLADLRLDPPPVQPPHPPIWVGGRQPAAQRRAARFADVWMPYMVSPSSLGRTLTAVREFATDAGRQPEASAAPCSSGAPSTPTRPGPAPKPSARSAGSTSRTSNPWPTATCCTATPACSSPAWPSTRRPAPTRSSSARPAPRTGSRPSPPCSPARSCPRCEQAPQRAG